MIKITDGTIEDDEKKPGDTPGEGSDTTQPRSAPKPARNIKLEQEIEAALAEDKDDTAPPDHKPTRHRSTTSARKTIKVTDAPKATEATKVPDTTQGSDDVEPETKAAPTSRWKRLGGWMKVHKVRATLLIVAIVLLIVATVTIFSDLRFVVMNWFGRAELQVKVLDARTNQPVNGARVSYGGKTSTSTKDGVATLSGVPYGHAQIRADKLGYGGSINDFTVGISPVTTELKLNPTGSQVSFIIHDKISGQPIPKAEVSFGDSSAIADDKGRAELNVPPQTTSTVSVTIKADSYGEAKSTVKIAANASQTVDLVPAGYIYFLSKQSGKIDVVKSHLDGSDRQTVLAGTGKESDSNTVLLASRDWKYLALRSLRDGNDRLYLIDTTKSNTVTMMDQTNARYESVGWQGSTFVYSIERNDIELTKPKRFAFRSYNAETSQRNTIDESDATADGASYQAYTPITITDSVLVYGRFWTSRIVGKQQDIVSVNASGANKKVLKSYPSDQVYGFSSRGYGVNEVYFALNNATSASAYVEYEDGAIKPTNITDQDFDSKFYPTYLASPTGNRTWWYESRDGKNVLLVGDKTGGNSHAVLTEGDTVAFGWYTDKYLLYAKKGSELYVLPADAQHAAIKVTDYHKPSFNSAGYGYGYGGF